ncbi:ABC transporter [uncultured Microbacterium sp.]|uniref:ABC transporter n=1 Tax=uncultured Microbacterium sp. TaxID=191216 RepID=UPI002632F96F|nr:ABC transporter [uncultured Microbacterium sp.]
MSDPEVPQNDQPNDIDDVVGSANEGLDAAAAARADVPADDADAETPADSDAGPAESDAKPVDADMEAFAAAERDHPGTFGAFEAPSANAREADAEPAATTRILSSGADTADVAEVHVSDAPGVADEVYTTDAAAAAASAAETQVVPAEPLAPPAAPQPIFVQAPEPPRDLGNRGTAGAIGLVAAIAFAILYLGAILGLGAWAGKVDVDNVGEAALAPLSTAGFWVPVAVFFLAFWLLGAFVNRARWGKWVVFGLLVGLAAWGGHILGQLFQERFWQLTPTESTELVNKQLLAPLAIAAFVFARELTIWFGAWVSRSGAKKKALNAEAQAEYERTLEAGPSALR